MEDVRPQPAGSGGGWKDNNFGPLAVQGPPDGFQHRFFIELQLARIVFLVESTAGWTLLDKYKTNIRQI